MSNKNNTFLSRILFNNKLVLILSVLISFVIWVGMSMGGAEEITKRITNIPIKIELSDEAKADGLQVFSVSNESAEISVVGNRLSIGSLSAEDIDIVATQASTITSPGSITLDLSAKKIGLNTNYEFSSTIYPSSVVVTVDRAREITMPLTNNIDYSIAEGYYEETTQYSSPSIIVTGPESEVSRVAKAVVEGNIEGSITETTTVSQEVILLDAYGDRIISDMIKLSADYVDVTIPVNYKKTLKLGVELVNAPTGVLADDGFITISPSEIEVAAAYSELIGLSSVNVASIDMSDIGTSTTKKVMKVELPSGFRNLSNILTVDVTFNMTGYVSKTFTVDRFDTSGCSNSSRVELSTKELEVKIIGPKHEIDMITADDLTAVIDFGNKAQGYTGSTQLVANIKIDGTSKCWAYSDYFTNVTITANQ